MKRGCFDCLSSQGEVMKVENTDTHTIKNVSRDATGEYKCSLIDDPSMVAAKNITVNCKKEDNYFLTSRNYCSFTQHTFISV